MTDLSDLRAQAMERDGERCRWPGCVIACSHYAGAHLELAHLSHRGLGGSEVANTLDNVVMLCAGADTPDHHGILDGRTVHNRRTEVAALLAAYLKRRG